MKKLSALIALTLLAAPAAYAQDGSSCAQSIPLAAGQPAVVVDTTGGMNWNASYGPLVSPSNDIMYTFTANGSPTGSITPTAATYSFALYLLNSCTAGAQPTPIGATGTIGQGISLGGLVTNGTQYWLAVTGTAAGGPGANGTVTFSTPDPLPVTLQSFEVN